MPTNGAGPGSSAPCDRGQGASVGAELPGVRPVRRLCRSSGVDRYGRRASDHDDDGAPPVEPQLAAGVVDIFVYVVVLNLFVEYLPVVISETFTLSLLTAALLKGVLEVVVAAKKRVVTRFRQASTPVGKVLAAALVWAVVFGSKFLVLEAVALVFGPRVSLGGFFSVTALILTLLLSRAGVRRLLQSLSHSAAPAR
jgi:hypothetical protein